MDVTEHNVTTKKVIKRNYTQKELDNIEASKPSQVELDKRNLAELRQVAVLAEEELMIMSGASPAAIAYKAAKVQI